MRIELTTPYLPSTCSTTELPRRTSAEDRIRTYVALSGERFTVSCDCPLRHLSIRSRRMDSDHRPPVYKTGALPLSYIG